MLTTAFVPSTVPVARIASVTPHIQISKPIVDIRIAYGFVRYLRVPSAPSIKLPAFKVVIGFARVRREREKEIMSICDEVSNKVQEYKRMNDNSMVLELENLKRDVS